MKTVFKMTAIGFISLFISCLQKEKENFEDIMADIYDRYREDTLKLNAVEFMLVNMPGLMRMHVSNENQVYFDFLKELAQRSELDLHGKVRQDKRKPDAAMYYKGLDSIMKIKSINPTSSFSNFMKDTSYVTKSDIIENLEAAFYAWKTFPWAKDIDFEMFKEYVLPYRVNESHSFKSKKLFLEKYATLIASMDLINDPYEASEIIRKDIHLWFKEDANLSIKYPFLFPMTFENIYDSRVGTCYEATTLRVDIMRALGVPTAFEIVPQWGNVNSRHYFYTVVQKKRLEKNLLITNENIYRDTRNIVSSSSYVGEEYMGPHHQIVYNKTIPKIFRLGFAVNPRSLAALSDKGEKIPDFFQNDRLSDVTSEYVETASIKLKLTNTDDKRIVYLAVFDTNDWVPVDWSFITDSSAEFKDIGKNIVYLPCYYDDNGTQPAGNPFLLDLDGKIRLFSPSEKKSSIALDRKFRTSIHNITNARQSLGLQFYIASRSDLSDSTRLMTLDSLILKMTRFPLDRLYGGRYVVCKFGGLKKATIAEIELIGEVNGKDTVLKGRFSGNTGIYNKSTDLLFDNDRNTFYESDDQGLDYFIVDLGGHFQLKEIRICPRNDTNDILPGDKYELFYWNGNWESVGIQQGVDYNPLIFSGPQNALFLLKNNSRGREERIFSYKNGKQYFY